MTTAHVVAYFALAAVGILAAWVIEWRLGLYALRRRVFSDLDSAYANGYFEFGEQLYDATAAEIAVDLVAYGDNYNSPHTLISHVRAWARQKGMTL